MSKQPDITVRLDDGSVVHVDRLDRDPSTFKEAEKQAAFRGTLASDKKTGVVYLRHGTGLSAPWILLASSTDPRVKLMPAARVPDIPALPKPVESQCAQCGKGIYQSGDHWRHSDGVTYRHPCHPKVKPEGARGMSMRQVADMIDADGDPSVIEPGISKT